MKNINLKFAFIFPLWHALLFLCWSIVSFAQGGPGKVRVNTFVDGIEREYLIHIPLNYDGSKPVPLVFMLHGTSGDADVFYNAYGWKELSETEGFIPVFPSSGRYKINDNGELKMTTKWNTTPDAEWTFQAGEEGYDDIKFLRKIILEMKANYQIDERRIYLNGFSNGGQMAAKCAVEMSDVLAAVAENAGSYAIDTVYFPKRKLPVLFQVGNVDYGPGNEGPEVPLIYLDTLITTPDLPYLGGKHYRIAKNHQRNFDLRSDFEIAGDTSFAVAATYQPMNPGPGTGYEFKFILVKGLAHNYPNGNNHPFNAPVIHWNWMKQYVLEEAGSGGPTTLTTNLGHGGGEYEVDTKVHIWSKQIDGKVFTHWSGDTSFLESPIEYHTVVTMPDKDISVTANYAALDPDMKLSLFNIKGAERTKKVLAYFPTLSNMKGVVWFFHGTNGNAANFTSDIETRQLIHLLMTRGYGIVGYTSEESEFDLDFDNDGNYRYTYGLDSTLLDFANIRAIRDTFIQMGKIYSGTVHIAAGYSAGSTFSEFVSNVLNWRAAVGHNSSGSEELSLIGNKPWLLSISLKDRNPAVGLEGNAAARVHHMNYRDRGVCATLHEYDEVPLFPERFDRSPLISEALSMAIYNELKNNNALDENNHFVGPFNEIELLVLNDPTRFPVILSLSTAQLSDLETQVQVTNAEHNLKADLNGLTLNFIEEICGMTTAVVDIDQVNNNIAIQPNPVSDVLYLSKFSDWQVYNAQGRLISSGRGSEISVTSLAVGLYVVAAGEDRQLVVVVH
ncbi:MAG: hypothetical protein IPN29_06700 [Saprospiraceae bacterium]|nr:hypothetical protein [Saprospiraceae bacterium]